MYGGRVPERVDVVPRLQCFLANGVLGSVAVGIARDKSLPGFTLRSVGGARTAGRCHGLNCTPVLDSVDNGSQ